MPPQPLSRTSLYLATASTTRGNLPTRAARQARHSASPTAQARLTRTAPGKSAPPTRHSCWGANWGFPPTTRRPRPRPPVPARACQTATTGPLAATVPTRSLTRSPAHPAPASAPSLAIYRPTAFAPTRTRSTTSPVAVTISFKAGYSIQHRPVPPLIDWSTACKPCKVQAPSTSWSGCCQTLA
ncbi:hypothetical protein D3C85_894940 [compost metagenome]